MRSLIFFLALTLQAQKLAPPDQQAVEKIKQFAAVHLDPRENLSCNELVAPSNTRTVTVEFMDSSAPRHGTPTSMETSSLFQDVFAASSGTEFQWDHWGTLRGKKVAVYRYSGKTRAGLIYADENTGAISRMTFRGTPATAHLFCTAQ